MFCRLSVWIGGLGMILSFIFGVVITFFALGLVTHCKDNEPKNKVHFYVARDKSGNLCLYICKPTRFETLFSSRWGKGGCIGCCDSEFKCYGLNANDYKDLKWEDEPIEVFLNLED